MSNPNLAEQIDQTLSPFAKGISDCIFYSIKVQSTEIPIVVLGLSITAIWFTLYLRFINIRGFWIAIKQTCGFYNTHSKKGNISHFQALATSISGTVGVGNIGGVALAIGMGGPGAVFWIWIAGFLAMSTKAVECTLATKFRIVQKNGETLGGPMYYLTQGLAFLGWRKLGKSLGTLYAFAIVIACFGIGNMFQSNQAYAQVSILAHELNLTDYLTATSFGLTMAAIVGLVIIGGIRSIASAASAIVPTMTLLYLVSSLTVIIVNAHEIPSALKLVIHDAFTGDSVQGGMLGVIMIGFQRALFSNEAGLGSASIAHSAVKTDEPASEGLVSLLEPFIDTLIILMLSSLVILTVAIPNGLMEQGYQGIELTSAAFSYTFSWFPIPLAIAACLFAFSTTLAWSYYGLQAWQFLLGTNRWTTLFFQLIFCVAVAIGAVADLNSIITMADALVFFAAIPNLIGLYFLAPIARIELEAYLKKIKDNDLAMKVKTLITEM